MGKVVDLGRSRPGGVGAEELLDRVTRYYRDQFRAREALPGTLAALVRTGRHDVALAAIVAWGEHGIDPIQLLDDCQRALVESR